MLPIKYFHLSIFFLYIILIKISPSLLRYISHHTFSPIYISFFIYCFNKNISFFAPVYFPSIFFHLSIFLFLYIILIKMSPSLLRYISHHIFLPIYISFFIYHLNKNISFFTPVYFPSHFFTYLYFFP